MFTYDARGNQVGLELVEEEPVPAGRAAAGRLRIDEQTAVVRAGFAHFALGTPPTRKARPPLARFRDTATGLVRTVYHEVAVRFAPGATEANRRALLARDGLEVRRENPFVPGQVIVAERAGRVAGAELVDIANRLFEAEEVTFATPNFVSEYRRTATIPSVQWHLPQIGAAEAWQVAQGSRVVVAVLDDGVDVEHPNLRVWRNSDRAAKDQWGRDFFLPDDHPDHFNPRPKKFRAPFEEMAGNDIHGTPCAGVIAAQGRDRWGVAPKSRVLAVKIFHADELAADERVADAIRYAATRAHVLSCSWSGPASPDIQLALDDVGRIGRRGERGVPVVCAAGNDWNQPRPVAFPARDPHAIAVAASTDESGWAPYSNQGKELSVCAPSSGGTSGISTTDVSYPGRGFSLSGAHTDDFGGTSSATPLVAGVVALMLSVNSALTRERVEQVLQETAVKIGKGYDAKGCSKKFGYGRVDAAAAVARAAAAR